MSELPDWTKLTSREKAEAILPHLAAGESNGRIASRFLNCGRCHIAGAVNRMKVTGQNPPSRRGSQRHIGKAATTKTPAAKAKPAHRPTKLVQQTSSWRGPNNPVAVDFKARALQRAASPGIIVKRENAFDPIPDTPPVAFGSPGCRWPVDGVNGIGLLACGAAKEPERSYCDAHRQLSYAPPTYRLSVPKGV
ncbi:GcrA family cell cycle regulator [Mesorhizobium neociceri]|uniref:GcrA cell cycle regulator n=1 Tax=Mesorhizobium neociceri TaxID=1307853 RepID=A0A838B6N1_9HYPH|nr:GcrA family cell cycle regulator [Mesorhizobium neociceri]MBA1141742.1 hypothetical protein [Mesorhizobium neociceri]